MSSKVSGSVGSAGTAQTATLDVLRRELARGTAELAVLSILGSGQRYGYELPRLLQGTGTGLLEIGGGDPVPVAAPLEDAGHVTPTWQAQGRARPRKYYAITAGGRRHAALLRAEWSGLVNAMQELLDTFEESEP